MKDQRLVDDSAGGMHHGSGALGSSADVYLQLAALQRRFQGVGELRQDGCLDAVDEVLDIGPVIERHLQAQVGGSGCSSQQGRGSDDTGQRVDPVFDGGSEDGRVAQGEPLASVVMEAIGAGRVLPRLRA